MDGVDMQLEYLLEAKRSPMVRHTYVINGLISIVGIVLNVWLIIATIKHKPLHSTCCVLVALYSLCCVFGFLKVFIPLSLVLFVPSSNFLSMATCAWVQLVPLSVSNNLFSLAFMISFDRLLSVLAPLWYVHRNERRYLLVLYLCSAIFPLYTAFVILQNANLDPERRNYCTLGDALGVYALTINLITLLLITLSMACYGIVWLKLKHNMRTNPSQTLSSHQPVLRALLIIMLLQTFGWLTGNLGFLVAQLKFGHDSDIVQYNVFGNIVYSFVCLCAAMDTPVLYWTSSEHRIALRKVFYWTFRCLKKPPMANSTMMTTCFTTRRVIPADSHIPPPLIATNNTK